MCDGNSCGKDGNHIFHLSDDTKPHELKEPFLPDESQGDRHHVSWTLHRQPIIAHIMMHDC